MINKDLGQITLLDLENLISSGIIESNTIEYKEELTVAKDSHKKEFLKDISAFANSHGGDLIYGIKAIKGIPTEVVGITDDNIDGKKLLCENLIRDGISPRINVAIQHIKHAEEGKYILLFRVKPNFSAPHCVIFQGDTRFYTRNSSGTHIMNLEELREKFLLTATLIDKVRSFRQHRISSIQQGYFPNPFENLKSPKLTLHVIPWESFSSNSQIDIKKIDALGNRFLFGTKGIQSPFPMPARRINFEGLLYYDDESFLQVNRNGIVEWTFPFEITEEDHLTRSYEDFLLPGLQEILIWIEKIFSLSTPIIIFLTLTGVNGYKLQITLGHNSKYVFDRDILSLPESISDSFEQDIHSILTPLFEMILNAVGEKN